MDDSNGLCNLQGFEAMGGVRETRDHHSSDAVWESMGIRYNQHGVVHLTQVQFSGLPKVGKVRYLTRYLPTVG